MGQLVPFPAPRATAKNHRTSPAASGRLIPFISPSRLFVAGMAAICPTLAVVTRRLGDIDDPKRTARERIVERLLLILPGLARTPRDVPTLDRLFDAPFEAICRLAHSQVDRSLSDRRLYALGQSVWRDIDSPDLREFAQRCSVFLIEAHHQAAQTDQTKDLAKTG